MLKKRKCGNNQFDNVIKLCILFYMRYEYKGMKIYQCMKLFVKVSGRFIRYQEVFNNAIFWSFISVFVSYLHLWHSLSGFAKETVYFTF